MSSPREVDRGDAGRVLHAGLHLLDRQLIDREGLHSGKVDDLELETLDDGTTIVTALLCGPGAMANRLGGRLGNFVGRVHKRLHHAEDPDPGRVGFDAVREVGSAIQLGVDKSSLEADVGERWTRDHIIRKIPGAQHAPE
jgi:hypothetical protein